MNRIIVTLFKCYSELTNFSEGFFVPVSTVKWKFVTSYLKKTYLYYKVINKEAVTTLAGIQTM